MIRKTEKGITLVTLIITIVILLVLATVSINAIYNTNIIEYVSNATNKHKEEEEKEKEALSEYNTILGGGDLGGDLQGSGNRFRRARMLVRRYM